MQLGAAWQPGVSDLRVQSGAETVPAQRTRDGVLELELEPEPRLEQELEQELELDERKLEQKLEMEPEPMAAGLLAPRLQAEHPEGFS